MLRVMLVDDERLARQALRQMLQKIPGVEIVGEADGAKPAQKIALEQNPDGIFLDVEMPGIDGFKLLRGLDPKFKVVFVTAHAEHAVRAFEAEAVDYLLKPVRASRLAAAVRRLEAACKGNGAKPQPLSPADRICFSTPGKTTVAKVGDVILLEAEGDFTRVHVAGESPLMICKPLRHYIENLPSPPFVRLDRSLLLNNRAILRLERHSRHEGRVWLLGRAEPVHLGRTALLRLRTAIHPGSPL